ncbi:F510_1955 family glycosylhydrolase [Alteribacter aurantiacus]|uniref:F510_1955 family glycosylhydrolase n=1 Tax=Alteribacter aurantiacus TaxID=254410 RepID=UPI0003F8AFD6|nr:hypothetical protein [Alteribacter aurantiacus]
MKKAVWLSALAGVFVLAACQTEEEPEAPAAEPEEAEEQNEEAEQVIDLANDDFYVENSELEVTHIHGLGYAGNEGIVYVATHHGLALFEDGTWYETGEERNDYMGFSPVEDGFYTSGHPGEASSFEVDPIGLVKSEDGGQTLEVLDLLGETDFHVKGTGYFSNAIYVYNPKETDRLEETGLYYTLDDAESWEKSEGDGLPEASYDAGGYPNFVIAVHPTEESRVSVGTTEGLFVSEDYGQTFEETELKTPVLAGAYVEEDFYAGIWAGEIQLIRFDGEETVVLDVPDLHEQDFIQYVAVNPEDTEEIVYTTFFGNGFITHDGGDNWTHILDEGNVVSEE